jgi:hypothetical protein
MAIGFTNKRERERIWEEEWKAITVIKEQGNARTGVSD